VASSFLKVVFVLAALEIGLRIAGWPTPGFYVNGAGPIELRAPGKNGGAFPPNVHGELRHYDYTVPCNTNSFGFRDAEVGPRQPGEWRIGLLGDSFTAGVGVRQEDRFADIFAAEIRKSNPNVTVVNPGAPLCGTACETEMLRTVSANYQLDEVVLAFYGGNDLEDNSWWYASADPNRVAAPQPPPAARFRDWLRDHSRLATFVWVQAIRALATFQPPGIYKKADLDRYWPDTDRALQALRAGAGPRLTIFYLPSPPEWDDNIWHEMRSRYGMPDDGRFLVHNAVANWAKEHKIYFIDATASLHKCQSDKDCLLRVDPHWTAKGHQLVAQALLEGEKQP
jgi:lysophospholipase L1-like esterase